MSPSKDREGVDNAPAKVSPSNDRDGVNGPLQKIKLAPAKVSPSNDRDGVKGLPQECRPPKIGMGRRLNRALQICSFQADGTKAPRHGAGLCVALGISTRFNARDGETNVRQHPRIEQRSNKPPVSFGHHEDVPSLLHRNVPFQERCV
ncbi:hypothetical protein IEO21_06257 [Rhodonia placenta]|uniref:Uncharacterized protein n=1 Tax=Rhodonia placenta TaxID=104341 RepID=A0A8H7P0B2_9APHY|nr:hypothetical protein IEO21_06257 [Postia placenta]